MARRVIRLCVVVLVAYWLGIFALTHLPIPQPPPISTDDKLAHFLAFFGLGTLLTIAMRSFGRMHNEWIIIAIAMAYGAVDEWTQALVGRNCSLLDWFADCAGVAAAVVACGLARTVLPSRRPTQPPVTEQAPQEQSA